VDPGFVPGRHLEGSVLIVEELSASRDAKECRVSSTEEADTVLVQAHGGRLEPVECWAQVVFRNEQRHVGYDAVPENVVRSVMLCSNSPQFANASFALWIKSQFN